MAYLEKGAKVSIVIEREKVAENIQYIVIFIYIDEKPNLLVKKLNR